MFKVASGGFGIESAGWEGGRLLPGAGNDKVLYYVNDHLGSVRTVKDGAGTVRQCYDYYPYGTVSRSWSSNSSSDTPDKRYRFGGKEIAGSLLSATATGSDKYLDVPQGLPGTNTQKMSQAGALYEIPAAVSL